LPGGLPIGRLLKQYRGARFGGTTDRPFYGKKLRRGEDQK